MIAGLRGKVVRTTTDAIHLDVGGVIYRVFSSSRSIAELDDLDRDVELMTHLVVREDAMILFGFADDAELTWFETLITVNGVGPRLALAILSKLSPEQIIGAVANEDVALLSTVPGVGKRTASRILLDLRGKLPANLEPMAAGTVITPEDTETIAALRALGYTAAEAQTAVARLHLRDDATPQDRVIAALKVIGMPVQG